MSPEDTRRLVIDARACTGCEICTVLCGFAKNGRFSLGGARIRIETHLPELTPPAFRPRVCRMCRNAACVAACPTGALQQEGASGLVVLREDVCTGCGLCEDACPFDAIWIDEQTSVAVKCDLCDGAPVCVEYCPRGALSYE